MDTAVVDGQELPLNPIARMRLNAELMGLVRERAALAPTAPMAALKAARIAAKIVATLKKLGVDLAAKKREHDGIALEGGPEPVAEPRVVTAKFYDFDPNRKHAQRKRDNAQAMELLRLIDEKPGEPLTDEQKQILARYSGTGGNLVGEDGKKGSAYEYYTPKPIATGMWDLLRSMGFKGGKVGDPCAGVGIFGACAPADAAMETVELNETSGRVNQLVNGGPGYSATVGPFESVASRTSDEIWDAVITNVPFGGVHDRGSNRKIDAKYQDQPLETYFILRSLEKLKPGGLAAFIVPPRVVSAKGGREEQLRIAASYLAEFRGAYRLPNSVFGTADADTITDVIVFRKFSRATLRKIEELREQNPALLVQANVQWTEFIGGMYFAGEGKRFILGEFVPKDSTKFRDVDRVVSDQSVPNIAKLLTKFPDSRIDWKLLEAAETEPIVYNEGDTMTLAGQTLEMRGGVWVALGKAPDDDRFDALGQVLTSATVAVVNKVDWTQANDYVLHLRERSQELDLPLWLRGVHRDIVDMKDAGAQAKYWAAVTAGLSAVEVMRQHAEEPTFNYLEEYPAVSEALQASASAARQAPASFSRESKAGLQKVGIVYDRKSGFSALWKGEGALNVASKARDEDEQVEAVKYVTQGVTIEVAELKKIYGEAFDPLTDDGWCVNAAGTHATKADDYYSGNLAAFLAKIDAEIAAASGAVRDKLLRQKQLAGERVARVDPTGLRFNLFSPYVDIEEKAEFLRRFMHPSFVVAYDDEGGKTIIADINPKTERERQLKRFAEYLKKGNLSTRTKEEEAAKFPELDAQRRAMLKDMTVQANAQFDQWVKSNPLIMDRLNTIANDPAKLYFNEVEDNSALKIDGIHPDCRPHGYQHGFVRKMARNFSGINGFDVGLGKTMAALLAAQYVQNIGVKKKTVFVVPNTVLSNWRKEALIGNFQPGHPQYRPPVYASGDGCLFVGLDVDKNGKASVDPANYARDLNRVLENKHSKIFCTLEAFKLIPLKDSTIEAYDAYLQSVDPTYAGTEKNAESERADSKRSEATSGTGAKSSAVPYFEDMGIDSLVGDELHLYKNSKNTVDFSGAKFLSVAEASQRGLDVQIKAWYIRGLTELGDGVLGLTATPITNSPLEIYSMLCLAVGERRVHDLCLDARGADAFMNVMCDIVEEDEMTIDGQVKPYRVFRGLQNVNLLRNAIATVMTIKTAADVKDGGDDLRLPEAPEHKHKVQLTPAAEKALSEYKLAYRGARESLNPNGTPTEEQMAALARVSEKFGEPTELIAHPFNLINKMTLLIADPELDERATFYDFQPTEEKAVAGVIAAFNKLGKIEARALAGPWTKPEAVVGVKVVRDGDNETKLAKIKVQAQITKDKRIVIDTMDTNIQAEFEKLAEKAGVDLGCTIPPKLAALLENVQKEEASPRSASGRVKQLIFCDVLPLHNKIKRLLTKHAGVAAAAIVLVSGQSIKNAEQMQGVQDGFNAEGEENRYRYVIANEKAEVGINLQKGTQAIHHLTIGWTPDSTIQRNGRGVRQGNTTARVNLYHYDADGTFDEYKRTLTSKKADWIGAVMDKQGGNDVAIAGGLTSQEYDELISAVGDAGAMQAIRERAELKEKLARAEGARARQVINIKTAQAQSDFAAKFPTAAEWIVDRAMQLYDLQQSLYAMDLRARSGKLSAGAQIKLETRVAELRARVEGMARELDEAADFESWQYIGGQSKRYKQDIRSILSEKTGYSTAAKVREAVEGRVKGGVKPKEGSALAGEWASEVAAAKGMIDEALKDFERLASDGGSYPPEIVQAFKAKQVSVMDGKLFARGMFARDKKGNLGVLTSPIEITRHGVSPRRVADAISAGWAFIMFGTPEYEAALTEAAQIDDAATEVTESTRAQLFSSIIPEVAARRKTVTLVSYSADDVKLPAPYFPFPINPDASGISAALRAVGASQMAVISSWDVQKHGSWETSNIKVPSTVDIARTSSYAGGSVKNKIDALVAYGTGHGVKFTRDDFATLAGYKSYGGVLSVDNELATRGKWPADVKEQIAATQDQAQLDSLMRAMFEAALPWLAAEYADSLLPMNVRVAYNSHQYTLTEAARRAAMAADPDRPDLTLAAPPPPPASASPVAPNARGLIGLTGETRPNKEIIKAAAKEASGGRGYARWNGDRVQWDVPVETWAYLLTNHPRVAQVLQVVPA